VADRDDGSCGAAQIANDGFDPADARRILAGGRLVQHHDRRPHREDGRERQEFPPRVAEVVRFGGRLALETGCP
jgi:hypothetical protein